MPFAEIQVDAADFDLAHLEFGDVKYYEKSKLPYVPVTYHGKVLLLKTPELAMPFGVGEFLPEGKTEGEKNIDLSFRQADAAGQAFLQKLKDLDATVLEVSHQRSKAWFGKQKSKDTLEDNQNKIVRPGKKEEYGDSVKVKFPKAIMGIPPPTFWNSAFQQVQEDYLVNNSKGQVIMELRPLYQVQGKFGLKWTVRQVLVTERPEKLNGCGFGTAEPAGQGIREYEEDS